MADRANEQTVAVHLFSLLGESNKTDKDLEMALKLKPKTVSNWRRGRSHGYMRYLPEIAAFLGFLPHTCGKARTACKRSFLPRNGS